jgi:hypothetical protein
MSYSSGMHSSMSNTNYLERTTGGSKILYFIIRAMLRADKRSIPISFETLIPRHRAKQAVTRSMLPCSGQYRLKAFWVTAMRPSRPENVLDLLGVGAFLHRTTLRKDVPRRHGDLLGKVQRGGFSSEMYIVWL